MGQTIVGHIFMTIITEFVSVLHLGHPLFHRIQVLCHRLLNRTGVVHQSTTEKEH